MTRKGLLRRISIYAVLLVALIILVGGYSLTTAQGDENRTAGWVDGIYRFPAEPIAETDTGWVIECVDCPNMFFYMSDRSLRLDADDNPHIAYGTDHLNYAWHDGTTWHHETVDISSGVGGYASLAIDGNGYPHISYCGELSWPDCEVLKYAYRDSLDWHVEIVDTSGAKVRNIAIDVDNNGYPHIGYEDNYGDLMYTFKDSLGWHILTLSGGTWRGAISLALDTNGFPHFAYETETEKYTIQGGEIPPYYEVHLVYTYQNDQGWHTETLRTWTTGDREFGFRDTSLVLDVYNFPHISYRGMYAFKDTQGWHLSNVDEDGYRPSISLDSMGYPHISYQDDYHENLKYAYQDTSGWHIQTITAGICENPSLALDGDNYPHISCVDPTNYDLDYYFLDSVGWQTRIIDDGGIIQGDTSLSLGVDGYPHISYFDIAYSKLKYTKQDAQGWQIRVVDI